MYIVNDVVYAGAPDAGLKVQAARVTAPHMLLVTFNTGEERVFDAVPLLDLEAFKPLRDEAVFEDFSISHGVLTWLDESIDIAPEALYRKGFAYERVA